MGTCRKVGGVARLLPLVGYEPETILQPPPAPKLVSLSMINGSVQVSTGAHPKCYQIIVQCERGFHFIQIRT